MRGVAGFSHQLRIGIALAVWSALGAGCVSFSEPARLYTIPEETQRIRDSIEQVNLAQYASLDEASRKRLRNDYIGARMYAIDIQYTPYQAALTKERQGVGFGAAVSTVALTTASGLVAPVATKNLLTGLAGLVTGARAAYDSDVLFAHSVQWIQAQMDASRVNIANRILAGMRLSTDAYPLAAALSDLEAYYRAGTFTGGILATSQAVAADARAVEEEKAETIEVTYSSTPSMVALQSCLAKSTTNADDLINLTIPPNPRAFARLLVDPSLDSETRRSNLLSKARKASICN